MQHTAVPKVLNKKMLRGPVPNSVYIGRPSIWGDPFVLGKDATRKEVIAQHEVWVARQPHLLAQLDRPRGRHLDRRMIAGMRDQLHNALSIFELRAEEVAWPRTAIPISNRN